MAAERTYLDHNATAPLRPEARAAMLAALDLAGNASSVHAEGRRARGVIEDAREAVAALLGAKAEEVVFTSGATEANNWVVRSGGWDTLVVSATEHDSVLGPARIVDPELIELSSDARGIVNLEPLHGPQPLRLEGRTLISLHKANGETGVLQPIDEAVAFAGPSALVHSDAVQSVGRIPVDFRVSGLAFMSVSAHKLGGPKGVGALVIRDGLDLPPLLAGGGQERRRRSGTENIAAIAGFGAAARAAHAGLGQATGMTVLRDRLETVVRSITPHAVIIGEGAPRLPNTSCIALAGEQAATLLIKLDLAGIAVSAGSACSSGKIGGSHVLAAMGIDERLAAGAIRVSLGPTTTELDIARFLAAWEAIHKRPCMRRVSQSISAAAGERPLQDMRAGE